MIEDKEIGYILHRAVMMSKNNFTNKLNVIGTVIFATVIVVFGWIAY